MGMLNNSSLSMQDVLARTQLDIQVYTVLLVLLMPLIVCGNLLVIIAILRFPSLRHASNMTIMSLAFADLMMGGVYLPLKIVLTQHPQLFTSRVSCIANAFLSVFCLTNAMAFLSLTSIERFYAIQFPFHYHSHMTINRSLFGSFLVCVLSISLALPLVCGIDSWKPGMNCFSSNVMTHNYIWTVLSVGFFISFMGFLSFLRVMAAEISIRMKDNARNVNETRKQDSVKATLMLTVYVFSIICWLPQLVYTCISVFNPAGITQIGLRSVSFLGTCSSGINCFIYGIKNRQFKAAFRKLFACKTPTIDVDGIAMTTPMPA